MSICLSLNDIETFAIAMRYVERHSSLKSDEAVYVAACRVIEAEEELLKVYRKYTFQACRLSEVRKSHFKLRALLKRFRSVWNVSVGFES